MNSIFVKICCIKSIAEAQLATRYGADALGLVSHMPSGPGVIPETLIAEIAQSIPKNIETFLLTSKQDANEIIKQHKKCNTSTIQICDKLLNSGYQKLRSALPGVKLVQVVHVTNKQSVADAGVIAENVDALLLDSGNQNLPVKKLGGTGTTHNWEFSKRIVGSVKIPVYLAGGLNAKNVCAAIKKVKPYAVDICSGVRSNDQLDEEKLKNFMQAALNCR